VDPEDAFEALAERVEALLGQGRYERAARVAQQLIDRYPDEDLGYFRMAEALLARKMYARAERYAEEAVARDPMDASNHALLADVREQVHGLAAAEEPLRVAADLEPERPEHRIRLGLLRVRLGRAADGVPDLEAALRLGAGEDQMRLILDLLAGLGLPEPVRPLYRAVSYLLARPDLSEPGAAGRDPALLAEQAAIARRLAVPIGQDEPTTRAAWRLSRELAEAVLAAEPGNAAAREALEALALSESMPYELYADREKAAAYLASVRDLTRRITDAYGVLGAGPTADAMCELFRAADELLRVVEAAGAWDTPGVREGIEIVTRGVSETRARWLPGPGEAEAVAAVMADTGLVEQFAAFYRWLAGEPAGE